MQFDFGTFGNLFDTAVVAAQLLERYAKSENKIDEETADLLTENVKRLKNYVDKTASGNPTALYTATGNVGIMYYQVNPRDERSCFACLSCTPGQARQYSQTFALCCNYFSLCEVYILFDTYFNLEKIREQED